MFIRKTNDPWVDIIAQDIKNIKEDSTFDGSYEREKRRAFVMAGGSNDSYNGLTS